MADPRQLFRERKLVIFDFDGTIADTVPLHDRAFQEALKEYPLEFRYRDYLGNSTRETLIDIFKKNEVPLGEEELVMLTNRKKNLAHSLYLSTLSFMPGAFGFIKELAATGMILYVGSSGSRQNITAGVRVLGLEPYFKGVITSEDVARSKPQPDIFLKVLDDAQVLPSEALVIEDSIAGIKAADAAGIDAVSIDRELVLDSDLTVQVRYLDFQQLLNQLQHELSSRT